MDVSVSPLFTVTLVAVRAEEPDAGRKICEPALIWFALRIAGLTESSSCQRVPLPKFCSAIFQSESPGFTITALSFDVLLGTTGTIGAAGATGTGATGCSGAIRAAGGRESGMLGGATKTLGRSKGERFTGGR